MRTARHLAAASLTLLLSGVFVPAAAIQTTPAKAETVDEAVRLRAAGDFAGAVRILRAYSARNPRDRTAARMLAETLYWMKDIDGAASVYRDSLARFPDDTTLRLQYGRMLVQTGHSRLARDILTPLKVVPGAQGDAYTLLGTIAYWNGDLTTAQRMFAAALRADPRQTEATRQLQEIRAASAPWMKASAGLRHDDQPLDRTALGFEAGWFATPLVPITVRVEPVTFRREATATRTVWSAEASVAQYAPESHLETEFAGGIVVRPGVVDGQDWRGRAAIGIRVSPQVTIRGRAERAPYLYTTSSIDTPVMTQTAAALLQLHDARGWLGEAAYQRERYPDANTIRSAYGWLLAPLVHRGDQQLQAGYSLARSNADASRFVFATLPAGASFTTEGQYVPYYTPDDLVSHSFIASAAVRTSPRAVLHAGGSYGFHATDNAPVLVGAQRTFAARNFSPWNARASLEVGRPGGLTVVLSGEAGRTVFYTWATGGVQLIYRFGSAGTRARVQ